MEVDTLLAHLLEYREYRLGAALDMILYAVAIEQLAHRAQKLLDEGYALRLALLELVYDMVVGLALEILKRQILQLALYVVQAELMGNLRVEVEALPALRAALLLWEHLQRAHNL